VVVDPVWRNVALQVVVTPLPAMLTSWRYFRQKTPDAMREAAAFAAA
jgi:hypothetical protein